MTIISQSHSFIFIHIRKCGGTSLEKAYEKQMGWNDLIIGSTIIGERIQSYYLKKFNLHKHSTSLEIQKAIGEDYWKKQFSFALVRHPRSIYESYFKWANSLLFYKSGGNGKLLSTWKKNCLEYRYDHDFLSWPTIHEALFTEDFNEYIFQLLTKNQIRETCFSFISDANACPLITKYYKLENIEEMWLELSEKFGYKINPLKENVSKPINIKWSSETKVLVDEKHQIDYEFFKYQPESYP